MLDVLTRAPASTEAPREPLSRQISGRLRSSILTGGMLPGERLPSTRGYAEQLGVSRTVVLLAYEQLLAEGFLVGRTGSGTYVAPNVSPRLVDRREPAVSLSRFGDAAAAIGDAVQFPPCRGQHWRYDFGYGRANLADFPFERWHRLAAKHARRLSVRDLDDAPAEGDQALRDAIAAHLRRTRGVVCDPSQVIVVSGSQQALDLIARTLIDSGDPVAIENPHYQGTREILRAAGATLVPVPVDDRGIDPSRLPDRARAAFITPSHQFPTGAVLPLARRIALLDWAERTGAMIVEDDYAAGLQQSGQPLQSLQGLDAGGRVIYVGTFSRTIFSALRIGYLVAPRSLVGVLKTAKWLSDRHTPSLDQRVLAEFIASGAYELYLRRLQRGNAARRNALVAAIERSFGPDVRLTGAAGGAHAVLWLDENIDEGEAIRAAASVDVGVYGVSGYFIECARPGLMLGYAQLSVVEIEAGIARLSGVLERLGRSPGGEAQREV